MSNLVKLSNRDVYVSEFKVKYIEHLLNICKDFDFIEKVILFGSVVEERCKETSDIDIVILGSKTKSSCLDSVAFRRFKLLLFEFDFSQDYDILYENNLANFNEKLRENIEKGYIIYEKY